MGMEDTTSGTDAAAQMSQAAAAAPPAASPAAPGASPAATPPQTPPNAPNAAGAPGAAPGAPVAGPAAAPVPAPAPQPSGIAGVMGSVLDMLATRDRNTVSRDANGNRVVTPAAPLTRGQQIAEIALTALKGATTAAAAAPGPGHIGQGVSAAVQQAIGDQQAASHLKDESADHDFAVQQKAKLDNINYQLLTRQNTAAEFELQAKQVKAGQESMTFANGLEDRELNLGSKDLGTYKNEQELPKVMTAQPQFIQKLHAQQIISIPTFGADGTRNGIHLYERRPNVGNDDAPVGAVAHKFVLGDKPGDPPTMQTFKPTGASNADIDRYNLNAQNQMQAYEKAQADTGEKQAQTREANANATAKPIETQAKMIEARASAASSYASAQKSNRESAVMGAAAGAAGGTEGLNHAQIVHGMVKGSIDITKAVGLFRNPTARLGFIADAQAEDPTWTMAKYQTMLKMREDAATGKMGDQVQSFQTFTGHAAGLSQVVDQLRNTGSPWLNKPINQIRAQGSGNPIFATVIPEVEAVKNEFQNFLANHALQKDEIERGEHMLNENQTLAQQQSAIKSFETIAITKLGAVNYRYKRTMGEDLPGLVDPNSAAAIKSFGLQGYADHALNLSPQQPQAVPNNHPQQAAAAGVPPGAQAGYKDGVLAGYQDKQGWHPLAGGAK